MVYFIPFYWWSMAKTFEAAWRILRLDFNKTDFNKTWETRSPRTSYFSWGLGHCLQPAGGCRKILSTMTWWEKFFLTGAEVLSQASELSNSLHHLGRFNVYEVTSFSNQLWRAWNRLHQLSSPSKKKKVRSKMQLSVFSPQNYYNENSSQWPMLILVCIRPHIYIDVYNVKP